MGIDFYIPNSEEQASTATLKLTTYQETYLNLQASVNKFTSDTQSLQGKSYDSARQYFSSVLLPLVQGGQLLAQLSAKTLKQLPSDYTEMVDSKSWEEDDLIRRINEERTIAGDLADMNTKISKASMLSDTKETLTRHNNQLIALHEGNIQHYETILSNLRTFDSYSPSIFSEIEEIETALLTGLAQTKGAWNATAQEFTVDTTNTQWVTTISTKSQYHKLSEEDKTYVDNLQEQYGFDLETSLLILEVKNKVDENFPDKSQNEKDYILNLIMGSFVYQEDGNGSSSGTQMWLQTAGSLTAATGLPAMESSSASVLLEALGMDSEDVKKLRYNIRLQHTIVTGKMTQYSDLTSREKENYTQSYNAAYGTNLTIEQFGEIWDSKLSNFTDNGNLTNADFAHQSITTATILRDYFVFGDLNGGKDHLEKLAGWLGDTTNAAGVNPSIANDDYRADLDAVNITERMKKEGISYTQASNEYYADIDDETGNTTRAKEFKKNQNYGEMESAIVGTMTGTVDSDSLEELRKTHPESYNFIMSVKNGDNNLVEYEPVED